MHANVKCTQELQLTGRRRKRVEFFLIRLFCVLVFTQVCTISGYKNHVTTNNGGY